ncbi:hypothetical protein IDJ81_14925 [Tsuneonella flava]|uniref:DUF5668 domain-containing protein n=1 Tax=Tsuneonella flava TaxID=2055955 RepID=A0ABX7K9H3_9SPHN|nr:hypothetical protein [Tsuneonella flava]QSB44563.1 hypothetical protein IDJ81_14925 [Tsuneonella flava]
MIGGNDGGNEDKARGRYIIINALRLSGVAIVILGLLIHEGLFDLPQWISWPLLAIGLIEVFVTPQILARMWRTPPE